MFRADGGCVEPEPLKSPRPHVGDDDVRTGYEPFHYGCGARLLQIKADVPLASV
jgi:hypothetical protein